MTKYTNDSTKPRPIGLILLALLMMIIAGVKYVDFKSTKEDKAKVKAEVYDFLNDRRMQHDSVFMAKKLYPYVKIDSIGVVVSCDGVNWMKYKP